jgi:hypothetical protein
LDDSDPISKPAGDIFHNIKPTIGVFIVYGDETAEMCKLIDEINSRLRLGNL